MGVPQHSKAVIIVPAPINLRSHVQIYDELHQCMGIPYMFERDGTMSKTLFICNSKKPNAWVDGENRMYLTEGLFEYNDDTLRFVMAHEFAHVLLGHYKKKIAVSLTTTGVMLIANTLIPGIGLLNHLINPVAVNSFSKPQELDADKLAAEACRDVDSYIKNSTSRY